MESVEVRFDERNIDLELDLATGPKRAVIGCPIFFCKPHDTLTAIGSPRGKWMCEDFGLGGELQLSQVDVQRNPHPRPLSRKTGRGE